MRAVADMVVVGLRIDRDQLESLKAEKPKRIARDASGSPLGTRLTEADVSGSPWEVADIAQDDKVLEAIVDDAVDRKTKRVLDELRIKANKKPAFDVFASMLELTAEQRASTERVVVNGQTKVLEILETPTHDGTNLMDGLVEIFARGMAQPGKDHGLGRLFVRIASEKIPGTDGRARSMPMAATRFNAVSFSNAEFLIASGSMAGGAIYTGGDSPNSSGT